MPDDTPPTERTVLRGEGASAERGRTGGAAVFLAGGGLALHVLALARTHDLLSGVSPPAAWLGVAAVAVGVAVLGRRGAAHRARRLGPAIGAALVAVGGVAAPAVFARLSGWPSALAAAALAFAPAVLVGMPARRGVRAMLAGAGVGALAASLAALPWLGPLSTSLVGSLLLLAGGVVAALVAKNAGPDQPGDEVDPLAATGRPPVLPVVQGALIGLLTVTTAWQALVSGNHPWPIAGVVGGMILLGCAVGWRLRAPLERRLPGAWLLVAAAACVLLPLRSGHGASVLDVLANGRAFPSVGVFGGLLTLVAAGVVFGAPAGLVAGFVLPRASLVRSQLVGLASGIVVAGAAWSAAGTNATALIAAVALALLATSALAAARARTPPPRTVVVVGALLVAAAGLALRVRGASTPPELSLDTCRTRPGRTVTRLHAKGDALTVALTVNGHVVSRRAPDGVADDLVAGHLAALLAPGTHRVLLVGIGSGVVLDALAAHGVHDVVACEPTVEMLDAARSLAPDATGLQLTVAPAPGALAGKGPFDAVIVQLDDPTEPTLAPFFTDDAYRAMATLLSPGGVLVQALALNTLGPEGLLRHVALLRETFPNALLASGDLGRSGSVVAIASTPTQAGAPPDAAWLPYEGLVVRTDLNPTMTPPVLTSLRRALVLGEDDLLGCFAADPRGIDALLDSLPAQDPWRPRDTALRHRAPGDVARDAARAMLYGQLGVVDLPLLVHSRIQDGDWSTLWPFAGVETRLPPTWKPTEARLRMANTFTTFLGARGVWRDESRRMVLAGDEGRIVVTEEPRARVDVQELMESANALWNDAVKRQGQALLHGHHALWLFSQPSIDRQSVVITWHCPIQGRLYAAELNPANVRPNLFEEPLRFLADHVECAHGAVAATTPAP